MARKSLMGKELISKLAGSFLRCIDTLTLILYGKYIVLGLGTFLVFLKRLYYA